MIPQSLEIPVRRGYLILFALEHLCERRPQVERCFVRRRDVPAKADRLLFARAGAMELEAT